METSVLTQHNDEGRTGANLNESTLRADNVNVNRFGKLFSCEVEGQIYAQPLHVPHVEIRDQNGASQGIHSVVYVATMKNRVYAFDAERDENGKGIKLWEFQVPPDKGAPIDAQAVYKDYSDILGTIGIVGTPVISANIGTGKPDSTGIVDTSSVTIYFVAATMNGPDGLIHQWLYSLDIATGKPIVLPAGHIN